MSFEEQTQKESEKDSVEQLSPIRVDDASPSSGLQRPFSISIIHAATPDMLLDKNPYSYLPNTSNNAYGTTGSKTELAREGGDLCRGYRMGGRVWRQLEQDKEAMRITGVCLVRRVGGGPVSTVYEAQDKNTLVEGKPLRVAVKAMNWSCVPGEYQRSIYANVTQMYENMRQHSNILPLLQRYIDGPTTYLVSEWCILGSLGQALGPEGCLSRGVGELLAREFYNQICTGLRFLFDQNISHGRLTCENVLLAAGHKLKLSDFGFPPSTSSNCTDDLYHLKFRSPELMRCRPYNAVAADIWSLGIVLYATLHAAVPYCVRETLGAERNLSMPELIFRKSLSYPCRRLIRRLLTYTPLFRPDLYTAMSDPWALEKTRLPVPWHFPCYKDQDGGAEGQEGEETGEGGKANEEEEEEEGGGVGTEGKGKKGGGGSKSRATTPRPVSGHSDLDPRSCATGPDSSRTKSAPLERDFPTTLPTFPTLGPWTAYQASRQDWPHALAIRCPASLYAHNPVAEQWIKAYEHNICKQCFQTRKTKLEYSEGKCDSACKGHHGKRMCPRVAAMFQRYVPSTHVGYVHNAIPTEDKVTEVFDLEAEVAKAEKKQREREARRQKDQLEEFLKYSEKMRLKFYRFHGCVNPSRCEDFPLPPLVVSGPPTYQTRTRE